MIKFELIKFKVLKFKEIEFKLIASNKWYAPAPSKALILIFSIKPQQISLNKNQILHIRLNDKGSRRVSLQNEPCLE